MNSIMSGVGFFMTVTGLTGAAEPLVRGALIFTGGVFMLFGYLNARYKEQD